MDGRVDVMPPNKFHCNKTQPTKNKCKRDFSLNESILGEVQLGVKCN
jgi:hypothetical protein